MYVNIVTNTKSKKRKKKKSLWGCKYGLLALQIIRKQGEQIVEKSEWSVICLLYIEQVKY